MTGRQILGIEVSDETLARWAGWFAPDPQPFLVEGDDRASVSDELRDTFELYELASRHLTVRWICEAEYFAMTRKERTQLLHAQMRLGRALVPTVAGAGDDVRMAAREQTDARRFVWWPSLLTRRNRLDVLGRFVAGSRPASRHSEVVASVWCAAEALLPAAHRVAGTFPLGSGPNCFGTVMAAAGCPGADGEWMQQKPFEQWLADSARETPSRNPETAGVVIVWRDASGQAKHAAVTLGSGWPLHKPSQGWMSPSTVLRTDTLIRTVRLKGQRLHRYALREAR